MNARRDPQPAKEGETGDCPKDSLECRHWSRSMRCLEVFVADRRQFRLAAHRRVAAASRCIAAGFKGQKLSDFPVIVENISKFMNGNGRGQASFPPKIVLSSNAEISSCAGGHREDRSIEI
jgi:hypothetical protein